MVKSFAVSDIEKCFFFLVCFLNPTNLSLYVFSISYKHPFFLGGGATGTFRTQVTARKFAC